MTVQVLQDDEARKTVQVSGEARAMFEHFIFEETGKFVNPKKAAYCLAVIVQRNQSGRVGQSDAWDAWCNFKEQYRKAAALHIPPAPAWTARSVLFVAALMAATFFLARLI